MKVILWSADFLFFLTKCLEIKCINLSVFQTAWKCSDTVWGVSSRVGEANPLFSVYIALWRSTALSMIYNVVGRQRNLGLGLPINNNQALRIPWVRPIQRQRSNWSPTYILHLFHLEDTSLLFLFISESVKVRFLPRVDSFSFAQEPHVVYCF